VRGGRNAPGAAEAEAVRYWLGEVSKAAVLFERRWTRGLLKRIDADLERRLAAQIADFDRACVTADHPEVERQGAATCRGYAACVRAMEAAQEADDAYLIGFDAATGHRIAIGTQRAAADRVAEVHGQKVVWYSADEIAALLARMEGLKRLSVIKSLWPGSEIVDLYPDEPAKADFQEDAA
jgi:hypothetical protein